MHNRKSSANSVFSWIDENCSHTLRSVIVCVLCGTQSTDPDLWVNDLPAVKETSAGSISGCRIVQDGSTEHIRDNEDRYYIHHVQQGFSRRGRKLYDYVAKTKKFADI